jgi:hypothetical protein
MAGYPGDLLAFYVESYSISSFLVGLSGRQTYLDFVADGMGEGWDWAVRYHYGFRDVDDLEDAWMRQALKGPPRGAAPGSKESKPVDTEREPLGPPTPEGDADKPPPPPARIEGTVTDEAGRRQPGLEVLLQDESGDAEFARTTTDDRGAFLFRDVTPGRYRIAATKAYSKGETRVRALPGKHTRADIEVRR